MKVKKSGCLRGNKRIVRGGVKGKKEKGEMKERKEERKEKMGERREKEECSGEE